MTFGRFGFAEPPPARPAAYGVVPNFAFDSDRLGPGQHTALIAIARRMMAGPATQFRLVGHTDTVGTSAYNAELGRRRAEAVRRALVATLDRMRQGSSSRFRLTVESAAATQQRVPSDRGAAGGLNRRVEVHAPIAQAPTPTNPDPDPVPKPTPNLQEVIERCLRVIRSSPSMPANQRSRLTCLLNKLRDTKTPDLYINGFSHELRTVPGNLPTDKIRLLFSRARGNPENRSAGTDRRVCTGSA